MSKYDKLFTKMVTGTTPKQANTIMAGSKPDSIFMAAGFPDPNYFPTEEIKDVVAYMMDDDPEVTLQYGSPQGYKPLLNHIVELAAKKNQKVTVDNVITCSGSTESFALMCKVFIEPGDYIVVEEPTYSGALGGFLAHGANLVGVDLTPEGGFDMDKLEAVLKEKKAEGKPVKMVYPLVNYQNPAGTTMPLDKRKKLLELAEEFDFIIFEDDAYIEFRYEGEELPSLFSMDKNDRVVYTTTFSKTFSPGLRVAYILAPAPILKALTMAKGATSLTTSPFVQALAYQFSKRGYIDAHVKKSVAIYKARKDAMLEALDKYMPDYCSWTKPQGGYFLWLTVEKEGFDGVKWLEKCVEKGVNFRPGPAFYVADAHYNKARLCFSFLAEDKLQEGIKRLAEAVKETAEA